MTFYGRFSAANTLPLVQIAQVFGTGGSPSATVTATIASNIAVGTTFSKIQYVFTMPSVSGKTFGTDVNDYLAVQINLPLNAAFTFDLSHVSLGRGDLSLLEDQYEQPDIGAEDIACRRFARRFPRMDLPMVNAIAGTRIIIQQLEPMMRGVPSVTIGSAIGGTPVVNVADPQYLRFFVTDAASANSSATFLDVLVDAEV